MGKLLIGHYGQPPQAESIAIALRDCHQRLGLKPSDFVSSDEPFFFKKSHHAVGKYMVFQVDVSEVKDNAVWREGYYLLPVDAAAALKAFTKADLSQGATTRRPVTLDAKETPPAKVLERAEIWADESQPLLFQCHCPELILRMEAPWGFRRRWMARLLCKKGCQPPLKSPM